MIVLEMMVDLSPLYVSLKTAIITIIITFFFGLFLAKWTLNRKHDLTKNILRVMYHTRMGDFQDFGKYEASIRENCRGSCKADGTVSKVLVITSYNLLKSAEP